MKTVVVVVVVKSAKRAIVKIGTEYLYVLGRDGVGKRRAKAHTYCRPRFIPRVNPINNVM